MKTTRTTKLILAVLGFALLCGAAAVAQSASTFIKKDAVLAWSTSAPGQKGALKILMVDGQYFEAEQTNEGNRSAGAIKLFGAMIDNGTRVVLINNSQWKEVWDGAVTANGIEGKLIAGSANYTFKIVAAAVAPAVSTAPFVAGKSLHWTSNAMGGQMGSIVVTSASGLTFTLDQKNDKNANAGVTKLEGELKDGKVYIYNRAWNETWTGTAANGVVTGTISAGGRQYTFKIYE